jgi:integrase
VNPATRVKALKQTETTRRAFTESELRRLLKVARGEWRGLILLGVYTGQRLGDLARLNWRQVDAENGEIRFLTAKTGKRLAFPLIQPLAEYLGDQEVPEDPDAPFFPAAYAAVVKAGRVVTLSNQFYELMVEAGLAKARSHESKGKGRDSKRTGGRISFHSLRHSAVTLLKASGVSDALAREIIGHDSDLVSRGYTHLDSEDVARAINKLPDITR